jgi:hypothetical protein
MARYQARREATSNRTHIVLDTVTNRPVADPERGGPLVWDNGQDATWYAELRNALWTHTEIMSLATGGAAHLGH